MSVFKARYPGTCTKCNKPISEGQYISWTRGKHGATYHVDCSAPGAIPTKPARGEKLDTLLAEIEAIKLAITSKMPESLPVESPLPQLSVHAAPKLTIKKSDHWLDVFAMILPHVRRVLLIGPPGTGKSTAAMNVAGCKYRITMTESTTKDDLLGYWELRDQKTVWTDGPVTLAMREGSPILVDEINCYSPEASSLLYSIIDDAPHVEIPSGTIYAKDGYKMIMTANDGLDTLPDAVNDRIEIVLDATMPCPDALAHIQPELAECCLAYYRTLPKPQISRMPSFRHIHTLNAFIKAGIDATLAAKLIFGETSSEVSGVLASIESEA